MAIPNRFGPSMLGFHLLAAAAAAAGRVDRLGNSIFQGGELIAPPPMPKWAGLSDEEKAGGNDKRISIPPAVMRWEYKPKDHPPMHVNCRCIHQPINRWAYRPRKAFSNYHRKSQRRNRKP